MFTFPIGLFSAAAGAPPPTFNVTKLNTGTSTTAGATIALGSITAAIGDFLICVLAGDSGAAWSGVTDTAGNTWTAATTGAGSTCSAALYYCTVTATLTAGTVTGTCSSSQTNKLIGVYKVTSLVNKAKDIASVVSGTSSGSGTCVSTHGTTTIANEVWFGWSVQETKTSGSPGSGALLDFFAAGTLAGMSMWKQVAATGTLFVSAGYAPAGAVPFTNAGASFS
jgi:hypothetical protein